MVRTAEIRHTRAAGYVASNQGWYFKLRAINGETIAVSEVYTRRWSAIRAARTLPEVELVRVYARSGRLAKTIGG